MPGDAPRQQYKREEALRLLGLSARQLRSWEKQGLVQPHENYGFTELLALRTLAKLRRDRVAPQRIKQAVSALRERLRGVDDPLTELKIVADGRRVRVHVAGRDMEPVSGQLLFDFDREEISKLLAFPGASSQAREQAAQRAQADFWFQRGLELEQSGVTIEEAIGAYEQAIKLDPGSLGALVNLGTIFFNAREWEKAKKCYLQALEKDPNYALALFNMGNLHDELNDKDKARELYLAALRVSPQYADVHYNLALLYQSERETLKAVRHWKAYLKLDPSSSWAVVARRELRKLKEETVVHGAKA